MSARDVMLPVIEDHPREDTLADAILSALTAAGYVVEQGWQDIATAPRDGTNILVYEPERYRPEDRIYLDWFGKDNEGWLGNPTRWRPLPAPPAQEPKK